MQDLEKNAGKAKDKINQQKEGISKVITEKQRNKRFERIHRKAKKRFESIYKETGTKS